MNRRQFLGGVSSLGVISAAMYIQISEERISSLEDAVSDLDERVSALEADQGTGDTTSPSTSPANAITLEGMGTSVSEKFALAPGRYRVNAIVQVTSGFDGFAVFLHGPSGSEDLLFNEIIDASGTWEGSTIADASASGEYFVEVSNTDSAWTLVFESF